MSKPGATAETDDVTPSAPGKRARQILRDKLVGRQIGRYDVLHRVASGGMGSVYVGRARGAGDFERLVAIKVLHEHLAHQDDFIAMFLDEARLAAQIRHPNVVATLDVCPTPEGYFLVMDYVEGDHLGSLLRAALRKGEVLPVAVVLRIVMDSLMGLAAAHGLQDRTGKPLNLVHRDVSPQNVLVGVDGLARLTDFGVAKAEHRISSTREGQFKGKLAYTSPEQAATGAVEQRSDLFAMGVVLWEALTAKRLFAADTNQATLRRLLDEPIPKLSAARPDLVALDGFMSRALARPLDERFQTAQEMAEAIETIAPRVGGLATTRAVSQSVRALAKEKLEAEHAAIEQAIAERRAAAELADAEAAIPITVGEEVDTVPPPRRGKRAGERRVRAWIAVAVVVALAGGALAWWATREPEAVADAPPAESGDVASSGEGSGETGVAGAAQATGDPTGAAGEAAGEVTGEVTGSAGAQPDVSVREEQPGEAARDETAAQRAARERAERLRRIRAAQRRAQQDETMTGESAMDETDILVNPYRNR